MRVRERFCVRHVGRPSSVGSLSPNLLTFHWGTQMVPSVGCETLQHDSPVTFVVVDLCLYTDTKLKLGMI